jgi:hypothetical protein
MNRYLAGATSHVGHHYSLGQFGLEASDFHRPAQDAP